MLPARWLAVGLVVLLSVVHGRTHRTSGGFQRWSTTAKVALILAFVAAGLSFVAEPRDIGVLPSADGVSNVFSAGFAVSLIFVSYSYSGWNAATYVTGELRDPRRTLPRALAIGTLLVMLLYVGLNYVFLRAAPAEAMVGRLEVGYIAAGYIFGPVGGRPDGDHPRAPPRLHRERHGARGSARPPCDRRGLPDLPAPEFDQRAGDARRGYLHTGGDQPSLHPHGILRNHPRVLRFHDGLNTFLAAGGVFLLRRRQASGRIPGGVVGAGGDGKSARGESGASAETPGTDPPYRTWGYPVTPLIFLAVTGWTLAYILRDRPLEAGLGLGLIAVGLVIYAVTRARDRRTRA